MTSFRGEHGFSLPEILITMVVLSVGLLAMAGVTMGVMKSTVFSSRLTTAIALAQEKLEEVRNQGFSNLCGYTHPVTEAYGSITLYPAFKRTVFIKDVGTSLDRMKKVTVSVSWDGDGRSVQLMTIVGE